MFGLAFAFHLIFPSNLPVIALKSTLVNIYQFFLKVFSRLLLKNTYVSTSPRLYAIIWSILLYLILGLSRVYRVYILFLKQLFKLSKGIWLQAISSSIMLRKKIFHPLFFSMESIINQPVTPLSVFISAFMSLLTSVSGRPGFVSIPVLFWPVYAKKTPTVKYS